MTPQRLSLALALVAGALFIAGAVVLIPWSALPSGTVNPHSVFTDAQLHAVRAYASGQRHLAWTAYGLNLLLALVLGLVPVVRRAFDRLPGPFFMKVAIGSAAISVVAAMISLPFDWAAFERQRAAGLSVETNGLWWRDLVVSIVVGWVPFTLAILIVALVVRRFDRAWPLVLGGIAGLAVMVTSLIFPIVVAPLFSSTHPLPPGPLRTEIFVLAAKEGVHLRDVVVADASTRTTAENAQVTGFGPTERLVLDDTLLRSMNDREIAVVVGHELGHAAHHDVLTGTLLGAFGAIAGVGLGGLVITWRRSERMLTGAGSIPVLFALVTIGGFLISPLENSMSRAIEARADRTSLAVTRDPQAFIEAQKQLNLAAWLDPTPPPWSQIWWGSHPTVLQRIWLAR